MRSSSLKQTTMAETVGVDWEAMRSCAIVIRR
jgi:hypothetical protein